LTLYVAALASMVAAVQLRAEPNESVRPLERGVSRGEIEPGVPRLDPEDPMANAALLGRELVAVGRPALDGEPCRAAPRSFALYVDGRLSRVRFAARAVCQLWRLKQISTAQPGFGRRGLAEVAAFVVGRRFGDSADVDVVRVVVPPFRFTGDTVTFVPADLGALAPGESFIGTYHTHPEGDVEEGVLSATDLAFMRQGRVDFHGRVGDLATATDGVDWLFDIVEPRDGDWNVYAHDRRRLDELTDRCRHHADCPVEQLRITGSRYYLFTRFFEGRPFEP
jgi:proteasome lid subunit RPN8/RPN11